MTSSAVAQSRPVSTRDDTPQSAHLHLATEGTLGSQDIHDVYDDWAKTYNEDCKRGSYNAPYLCAQKLSRILPDKESLILDVACGTGMAAKELSLLGYNRFDGVDVSANCLELAKETNLYQHLKLSDAQAKALPFQDDSYDALICVGAFLPGHLNQSVFPEFCRVVKPGGVIVVTIRETYIYTGAEFMNGQLDLAALQMAQNEQWTYLFRDRTKHLMADHPGVLYGFQVL